MHHFITQTDGRYRIQHLWGRIDMAVLIPLMKRVIVAPVRKIVVAINPTESLF